MKKLLFLVLVCASFASAQSGFMDRSSYSYIRTLGGTQVLNRTYTASTLDTSQTISLRDYLNTFINVQSKDSASITIKYLPSIDGVTWGVLTTLDSLSTASNTGDIKSVSLSTITGIPYIRIVLAGSSFRLGTSTATYTASVLQKQK